MAGSIYTIKMLKNKKGSEFWAATKIPFWILFGVILAFSAIVFLIYITSSGENITKIRANLESYLLTEKFSRTCFSYYDSELKKIYSGIIDYEKFTDAQLRSCVNSITQNEIAFRVDLTTAEQLEGLPKAIKTTNWNDNRPVEERKQPKRVLIFYSGNYYNGDMIVEIQNIK